MTKSRFKCIVSFPEALDPLRMTVLDVPLTPRHGLPGLSVSPPVADQAAASSIHSEDVAAGGARDGTVGWNCGREDGEFAKLQIPKCIRRVNNPFCFQILVAVFGTCGQAPFWVGCVPSVGHHTFDDNQPFPVFVVLWEHGHSSTECVSMLFPPNAPTAKLCRVQGVHAGVSCFALPSYVAAPPFLACSGVVPRLLINIIYVCIYIIVATVLPGKLMDAENNYGLVFGTWSSKGVRSLRS